MRTIYVDVIFNRHLRGGPCQRHPVSSSPTHFPSLPVASYCLRYPHSTGAFYPRFFSCSRCDYWDTTIGCPWQIVLIARTHHIQGCKEVVLRKVGEQYGRQFERNRDWEEDLALFYRNIRFYINLDDLLLHSHITSVAYCWITAPATREYSPSIIQPFSLVAIAALIFPLNSSSGVSCQPGFQNNSSREMNGTWRSFASQLPTVDYIPTRNARYISSLHELDGRRNSSFFNAHLARTCRELA